ncbi:hypothetical protein RAB80_014193 [Fusarium oxysporum f. sp. vasinfectum]|nr:hypothetical protein RAB80_014193 [Fusarium oxysporum f. sp. vasinfectum]
MTRGQKRQATAESRGSGSDGGVRDDEVGNIGCHEKQNKRKRPAIDEEKQPGWWPRNYAPGNPRCTRILGGMRSLIRTYQKAGRDPNDMWKEDGEDGCMVKAIRELGQGRVTQRVFKRVKPPFVTVEKPTKRAVGTDKRKLKREGSSAVENNTHDESTDDLANPHSPSCQGDGDESASRDNHSMLEPRSEKIAQDLREQIKNSETTEALHKDIQDWITKFPSGNDFQNKWLNEMKSSTKSTNDSMMAESKLLPEKLRIAEAEYDESHKKIQQLGEQIQSHSEDLEAISNSIEKTKQALAYIKQECAQIAEHNVENR